ncbi:SphA family protein [Lysobacter niastensis]|uniref:Transporter n=1 Tax=Lysobacter niastensis TaxID=380629 RepID=A0ABS0B3T5_9GAMM|nr:transporter [Lysobacter niastensis]MBF6023135.1 transporter [Lysobacter niastensis]
MKHVLLHTGLLGLAASLAVAMPAHAVEGALGRTITGTNITSYAGVIPPAPGFTAGVGYVHYSGDIGGSREVPLNNVVSLGVDATFDMLSLTGVYVWDTGEGRWNFASMGALPLANVEVDANVSLGPRTGRVSDEDGWGLFDPFFAPVIASYHFDKTHHMSLALYVYTDWGSYDANRLANLSLNNWTFSPTVGYTQLMQKGTLEFSVLGAFDIYTKNDATDYENGTVFRLDAQLIKRFANGWGVGGIGGWIEQIEDDDGPTADRLNGFKGRAFALGPTVNYTKHWKGGQVEFAARWLQEFDVKNRIEGDPLMVTAMVTF